MPVGVVKRLSEKELQSKREKGECFRCDEKWSLGHRCKKKELSVILMQDDEVMDDESLDAEETTTMEREPELRQPEISLNSVVGITSPKTMKLVGEVQGHKVVVMIDPGATHNFVSLETVQKLGITVLPSKEFGVSVGTGDDIQ